MSDDGTFRTLRTYVRYATFKTCRPKLTFGTHVLYMSLVKIVQNLQRHMSFPLQLHCNWGK